jgi:hypothetical protein
LLGLHSRNEIGNTSHRRESSRREKRIKELFILFDPKSRLCIMENQGGVVEIRKNEAGR